MATSLKDMVKFSEDFVLKESISPEDLYELMVQNAALFPGQFKLKKGLLGKTIDFDLYMNIKPKISVKGNKVTIKKFQSSSQISVGGMPGIDIKATKQRMEAVKDGGLGKAVTGGLDYFQDICLALREMLQSRM